MGRLMLAISVVVLAGCDSQPPFDAAAHLAKRAGYEFTIRRDIWGVPHVHGRQDADAAFGLAYAQGEDHWALIEDQIPFYRGTNARYNGPDAAATDYLVKWLGIWPDIEARYEHELSSAVRQYIEGFVDGLNYYAATHPESVRHADVLPITAHDVVAGNVLRHLLFYGFEGEIRKIMGSERAHAVSRPGTTSVSVVDGERDLLLGGVPVGSNALAVSPRYTTDGATRLAINSHQPTTGPVAWYEAHVRSNAGLDVMGGLFPGSPSISLGFNRRVAWAATVNRPDLVDVYVLEMHPEDDSLYRLDGEWVALEQRSVDIELTLWEWLPWTSTQEVLRSRHGPVLRTQHGTYAVRYAGDGEIRQADQWYRLGHAASVDEWMAVMGMQSFANFNFVAADAGGNIVFLHNSLTPRRTPGYDWSRYLPGDDSSLIWSSYLPFDALPQVRNPDSGYVVSANQTPFRVTAGHEDPDPADFSPADGFQTLITNRSRRALELFDVLGPIDEQEFFDIKHDKYYSSASRAAGWVRQAFELDAASSDLISQAQDVLARWDLGTGIGNRQAALGVCVVATDWEVEGERLHSEELRAAIERCATRLLQHHGSLEPEWGEVNRHVRGGLNLPVGGGPDILRAIYGRGMDENGYLTNVAGDGLYYLVSWDVEGRQQIRGTHHFGSATLDEDSPHYADQASAYASETLRDPLFEETLLLQNLERSYSP